MEINTGKTGAISEWNEGNLKSLRLHEAQEMINIAKINPTAKSSTDSSWNYQNWIAGIDILFGEGNAKYSDTETKSIKKIREVIDMFLVKYPIHKSVNYRTMTDTRKKYKTLNGNWERLRVLIEMYEEQVKYYNDKHGLSTRNKMTEGLFG